MAPSLGERIEAARRSRFVGRMAECDLFRQALTAEELPFYILHIYGPGGIGKTTLLHQFTQLAREAQAALFYVDSRELDPSPERFVATLQAVVNVHSHACRYYMAHFAEGNRQQQQNVLFDYIYLHRENPVVRPYFEWQERGAIFLETMQPADRAPLLALIERHEGAESAGLAEYWLGRQPHNFLVFRDAGAKMQGVLFLLALDQARDADLASDPAARAVNGFLRQHAPLRTGECATFFRFWLATDSYQAVSPVQSRIFLTMVQHYLTTPGLAYTFIPCSEPDFWTGVFAYADLHRLGAADYTIGGRRYGIYGHDWRVTPPLAWLNLLAEREIAMGIPIRRRLRNSRQNFSSAKTILPKRCAMRCVIFTMPWRCGRTPCSAPICWNDMALVKVIRRRNWAPCGVCCRLPLFNCNRRRATINSIAPSITPICNLPPPKNRRRNCSTCPLALTVDTCAAALTIWSKPFGKRNWNS